MTTERTVKQLDLLSGTVSPLKDRFNPVPPSSPTPGPWAIDRPYKERGLYIQAENTMLICKMYGTEEKLMDRNEGEANARLIASAPELLAALKFADKRISSGSEAAVDFVQVAVNGVLHRAIKAAIAKAEGR